MDKKVYVCSGTCNAEISEEQYKAGLTKCGTESCSMYDQPFETRTKCAECGAVYKPDDGHQH